MKRLSNQKPKMEHIFFDEKGVSIDNAIEDEVRLGTRRDMQPGRAVYFDGTNTIKLDAGILPLWTNYLKVSVWVYPTVINTGGHAIVSQFSDILVDTNQWTINFATTSWVFRIQPEGSSGSGSTVLAAVGTAPVLNKWQFVEAELSNGFIKLTVDGVAGTPVEFAGNIKQSHYPLILGGYLSSVRFSGRMHDLRISTSTQTALHYKLDDAAGTIAKDSSGNARHGAWTGLVTSSHYTGSDVPFSWQNTVGYSGITPRVINSASGSVGYSYSVVSPTRVEVSYKADGAGYAGFGLLHMDSNNSTMALGAAGTVTEIEYVYTRLGVISTVVSPTSGNGLLSHVYDAAKQVIRATMLHDGTVSVPRFGWSGGGVWQVGDYLEVKSIRNLTLLPRNEASPRLDVLGNRLTFEGLAPLKPKLKQSNCGNFDGTHSVKLFDSTVDLQEFDVEFYMQREGTTGRSIFSYRCDQNTGKGFAIVTLPDAKIQIWTPPTAFGAATSAYVTPYDTPVKIRVHLYVTGTVKRLDLYVNDVFFERIRELTSTNTIPYDAALTSVDAGTVLRSGVKSIFYVGRLWALKFSNEFYPFSEGGGAYIYKLTGGTKGLLTGDATVFWSRRQDVFHHNFLKGFNTKVKTDHVMEANHITYPIYNAPVTTVRNGVTNFVPIPYGVRMRIYITSPTTHSFSHGGFGAGTVTAGNTNTWVEINTYTTGNYALLVITPASGYTHDDYLITAEILTKVPLLNKTTDVRGNISVTNPAGPWHNLAETAIDFTGGVAAPLQVPTDWKSEADTANMQSRRRGNKIDRIILDTAAPTGNKLLQQKQYAEKP